MKSVWEQTWEYTDFPSFERDVTTNVLIGGGVAGVLCAYFLHQAGIPCCCLLYTSTCPYAVKKRSSLFAVWKSKILQKKSLTK